MAEGARRNQERPANGGREAESGETSPHFKFFDLRKTAHSLNKDFQRGVFWWR
jgi:hypothetical protein